MEISGIEGVIFDMDGTLMDSESLTDLAVAELLDHRRIDREDLDLRQFHGITWPRIADALVALFPSLEDVDITGFLSDRFIALMEERPPALIPGARQAFVEASRHFPVAIATGSWNRDVEQFLARTGLAKACTLYTGAEIYARSKPDPECYLLTADRMGLSPAACLVFEDSLPGLQAARRAGMRTVAVDCGHPDRVLPDDLADLRIVDYGDLPEDFFRSIGRSGL